jgi:hypothetical protein
LGVDVQDFLHAFTLCIAIISQLHVLKGRLIGNVSFSPPIVIHFNRVIVIHLGLVVIHVFVETCLVLNVNHFRIAVIVVFYISH